MDSQELRNLQEAYLEVYGELDEGRGDDLRTKYGLKQGEVSARLSKRAERTALNIGSRTHFDRQKSHPLLRLSGLSKTRSQGITPAGNSRRNSQGQLRDIRSRGGRPSNIHDAGADRDRGDKGERFASFVSGKRDNPNMTDSERRFAHHNREEYDLYDIILSHLLDEGYAETIKSAEAIMVNMSEEWREDIMERENSPYEKASDAALDARYGYGRASGDKRSFGRAANRSSAARALRAIRRGERSGSGTSREAGADAVHQGWAHTARTSSDQTPEKKERRAKLADTPYSQLPDDEKEKDRVSFDAVRATYNRNKK